MITEKNVSENAKQVIEILTANMPKVFGSVGIKEYTNKYGEIASVSVNVGTNFAKKKEQDIEYLENGLSAEILATMSTEKVDTVLLERARVKLLESAIKPNKKRSDAQINAYTIIAKGLKVHNETGSVFIYGSPKTKKVIVKGVYPIVKSQVLTLAKNIIRKNFSYQYRQYNVDFATIINTGGKCITFE